MLTEQDKQDQEKKIIEDKIKWNSEIIVAAAKYERLAENRDYQGVINDMKSVKEILDNELLILSKQLVMEEDPIKRETVYNEFLAKSVRRMVVEEGYHYTNRITHEASVARDENVVLRQQLKEKYNAE
jgi:hypothetical protein